MFTGHVGPGEVFFLLAHKALFGNFYWHVSFEPWAVIFGIYIIVTYSVSVMFKLIVTSQL